MDKAANNFGTIEELVAFLRHEAAQPQYNPTTVYGPGQTTLALALLSAADTIEQLQARLAEVERERDEGRRLLAQYEKMGWFCAAGPEFPNAVCVRAEAAEAERDGWKDRCENTKEVNGKLRAYVDRLTADRDRLRRVVEEARDKLRGAYVSSSTKDIMEWSGDAYRMLCAALEGE